MIQIKEEGKYARKQFMELADKVVEKLDDYVIGPCNNWINQAQKVTDYFWIEFKNNGFEDCKSSISLTSWKDDDSVLIFLAVEARDNSCSTEDFKRHNRFIYKEMNDPDLYYRVEYNNGEYKNTEESREDIIQKCEDNVIKKVRLQMDIIKPYSNDLAEDIIKQIVKGIYKLEPYYDEIINSNVEMELKVRRNNKIDNNIILYGPPGTGKTYNTVNYAVAIIENTDINKVEDEDYGDVYERYLNYKNEGRVEFTTFHQSYGYEEFIEGIKPQLKDGDDNKNSTEIEYILKDGLFKEFCKKANKVKVQNSSLGIGENPKIWNVLLDGTGMSELKQKCFYNNYIRIGFPDSNKKIITEQTDGLTNMAKRILINFQDEIQVGDIVLIQKDKITIDAIGIVNGPYEYVDSEPNYPRSRSVHWVAKNINEDVFRINKEIRLDRKSVYQLSKIDLQDVIRLIEKYNDGSKITIEENKESYVFIIDEINRGNISKIFGELITLIEDKKRLGETEEMTAKLPYSGDNFGVPNNVYIIGTMNTADRSIALMDTALRRRFNFVEMMPESSVLQGIPEIEGINIIKMLDTINERIELLYDREHTIGHAYFTCLKDKPTIEKLGNVFKNSIVPLLQEYFYEDYSKIQLVLGDNAKEDKYKFILNTDVKIKSVFKGNLDIDVDYLPEKKYIIQNDAFNEPESYKQIY